MNLETRLPPRRNPQWARQILDELEKLYPEAAIALKFNNTLELLVAVLLSAQCTDVRVNMVTEGLFRKYRNAADYAAADPDALAEEIRSCGLFRVKSRNLVEVGRMLLAEHGGEVPEDYEALVRLPGIGRKSAHVILSNAFGRDAMAVDTHVARVSRRLGLTEHRDPVKIEMDLCRLIPRDRWSRAHHLFIWHGRRLCHARRPACPRCPLEAECPGRYRSTPKSP